MKLKASGIGTVSGRLFVGTAEKIPPSELIDTTGAGDAFVGAVLYGVLNDFPALSISSNSCKFDHVFCFSVMFAYTTIVIFFSLKSISFLSQILFELRSHHFFKEPR